LGNARGAARTVEVRAPAASPTPARKRRWVVEVPRAAHETRSEPRG